MRGPLDPIGSIKTKLGIVIVAAVGVTATLVVLGARTGLPLWLCGVAAVAIALAMVQFLARGMTAPLRQMAAAAGDMAEGRPARPVATAARDEVGQLAHAFNRMSGELAQVDRERRELIANVSHELRTPISALRAVLENIVDGVEPADPATLRTMLAQVDRLGRLVAQLLDLSRLEAGQAAIENRPFVLAPVLEAAIREAQIGRRRRDAATPRAAERGPTVARGKRRSRADPSGGGEPARERDPPLPRGRAGGDRCLRARGWSGRADRLGRGARHPRGRGGPRLRALLPL